MVHRFTIKVFARHEEDPLMSLRKRDKYMSKSQNVPPLLDVVPEFAGSRRANTEAKRLAKMHTTLRHPKRAFYSDGLES